MNRSAKIVLVAAGVVIATYPGVAWLTGVAVQRRIENGQQALLQQVPYLQLVKQRYDRGVYTSTDVVTYRLVWPSPPAAHAPCNASSPCTVTFHNLIEHGPLPGLRTAAMATIDSTVVLPPKDRRAIAKVLGEKPFLRVHTRIGWLGGIAATVQSPAFTTGPRFSWKGFAATVTSRGRHSWSLKASLPGVSSGDPAGGQARLTDVALSGHWRRAFGVLDIGAFTLTADRIQATARHTGPALMMRHLSVSDTSSLSGGFLDLDVRLSADAFRLGTPARPVTVTHVVYALGVDHIDAAAMVALTKAIRTAEAGATADPAQYQANLMAAVFRCGPQVLLHQPVIRIRQVGFSLPQGSVRLSGKISVPGLSAADLRGPAVLPALKSHAQVTADVRVDRSLLTFWSGHNRQAATRSQALERMGYLSPAGTALVSHLVYTAGKLTVNGHPYPPVRPN